MLNRAAFRAAGLQGRRDSIEVFGPVNRWERFKLHLPAWLRARFPARTRSVGWRGSAIVGFLSSWPLVSHQMAARAKAQAKIQRMVTGRPVRVPGRSRRKRAIARHRVRV